MKSPTLLFLIASPLAVFAWTGGVYDTEAACKSGCPGDVSASTAKSWWYLLLISGNSVLGRVARLTAAPFLNPSRCTYAGFDVLVELIGVPSVYCNCS